MDSGVCVLVPVVAAHAPLSYKCTLQAPLLLEGMGSVVMLALPGMTHACPPWHES